MSQYFHKQSSPFDENVQTNLYLSNYSTKSGVKQMVDCNGKRFDLINLKSGINSLDIGKKKTNSLDLKKLSNVEEDDSLFDSSC